MPERAFDLIVVGGGHAGIEAALAAARLGARAALVTHDLHEIGRMPCNPAIGGLGKGHLVREIDVLGGEMGRAIDSTGIQFRILNRKKGPAVQSPRAQADKHAYQDGMLQAVLAQAGLEVVVGDAVGLETAPGSRQPIVGIELKSGERLAAPRVVLCTGTFLKGLMHVGDRRTVGGREGADSSEGLSAVLLRLGFQLRRLKTGTPPRLARDSIRFAALTAQPGDQPPVPFSFRTRDFAPAQIDCHLAYTNARTHALIGGSLDRSPLYAGAIEGRGPRYCPSIEDKVVRFADKDRHLLFLEPEGRDSDEIYVNGLSTSLPADVQDIVVKSVEGLENARIVRYGYAVEYDSIPSWQVRGTLESAPVAGLFLAGQILGTSGYEEAAAQGLLAGVNAVFSLSGRPPLILGREEAYLGVLVDDLVTKQIDEPYRMFTSRAEHRLYLRCDNAEDRLMKAALELGLLGARDQALLAGRRRLVVGLAELLERTSVFCPHRGVRLPASEALRMPGLGLADLEPADLEPANLELADTGGRLQAPAEYHERFQAMINEFKNLAPSQSIIDSALGQVENDIRYDGYIAKHNRLLRNRERLDQLALPAGIDYLALKALSFEAREKLERIRPATLGQAGRIDGVRAGDLAVLTVLLKKWRSAPPPEVEA